jgi:hypothetical protein
MRTPVLVVALGVLAFALLAVRFSPDWLAFHRGIREAIESIRTPEERAAMEHAILSGHSERGLYVIRQARDLNVEIDEATHKIVRWRLLVPALGRGLRLPEWLTLGLAHLGCVALVVALTGIGQRWAAPGGPWVTDAVALAVLAGATAPFFTSMGWLGYYDSLLALGLLAVAFARARWLVVLACLATPWIDERFVLGAPLALGVRWLLAEPAERALGVWLKREALLPLVLLVAYTALRLHLGGSGGSQTVGGYLREFVFSERYPVTQRLYGAWSGLRFGWVLVVVAVVGASAATRESGPWPARLLGAGIVVTGLAGLLTAMDLSRSMVLLLPVVPLGWIYATRALWWKRTHVGPALALLALGVPASHVIANRSLPVDNMWTYSLPLMTAQSNLGLMYLTGDGVPKDGLKAERWLRRAAEEGVSIAQNNLGLLHAMGNGVKQDSVEAARWFRRAAEQGVALSQVNLGVLYANGDGVPKDLVEAHALLALASLAGQASAVEKQKIIEMDMTPQQIARARERVLEWQRTIAASESNGLYKSP